MGSAIYMGRWLKPAREFVTEHAVELSSLPVWLFSSGPLGPPDHPIPPEESPDNDRLAELVAPVRTKCSQVDFERSSLGFAERVAARVVHAPEGDCRA